MGLSLLSHSQPIPSSAPASRSVSGMAPLVEDPTCQNTWAARSRSLTLACAGLTSQLRPLTTLLPVWTPSAQATRSILAMPCHSTQATATVTFLWLRTPILWLSRTRMNIQAYANARSNVFGVGPTAEGHLSHRASAVVSISTHACVAQISPHRLRPSWPRVLIVTALETKTIWALPSWPIPFTATRLLRPLRLQPHLHR